MLPQTQINIGCAPATEECILVNRTGGTLVKGDLVSLNLDFASVSGQAMVGLDPANNDDGAGGYVLGAACSMTTAKVIRCVLVARETILDNAKGKFGLRGVFDVLMNGANAGELLTGTDGQKYATPLTVAELQALTTGVGNVIGIALEATSGAALGKAWFNGEAFRAFFGGDT